MPEPKGERAITENFVAWYGSRFPDSAYVREFKTQDGNIDLCTFRWASNLELECWGVECKVAASLSNIHHYLEQLSRYHESFVSVYLLVGSLRDEESVGKFCKARGIGLYVAPSAAEVRRVTEAGARDFDSAKYARVRGIGAALLCFRDEFPHAEAKWWGANTKGEVQFNVFYDIGTNWYRLGVNVENISKPSVNHNWAELIQVTRSLPMGSLIGISRDVYLGRVRVTTVPVSTIPAGDLDVGILGSLGKVKREPWHINVNIPLWLPFELLTKEQHSRRLRKARETLTPVFEALGGRAQSQS